MEKKPLIVIAGPTAVGKTALSVRLAKEIGGEIVSADSMQVYRGMDIGTAKITPGEMQGVPHYLIDILEPEEPFSIVTFQNLAKEAIGRIYRNGHVPVIAGGTGFYIQSVLYDIDFDSRADDPSVRVRLTAEMQKYGPEEMHERLKRIDPESAAAIHPNNRKRVIRALEFFATTGKKISEHNAEQHRKESPYRFLYYVLAMDRAALYRRIDTRVDRMIENGLVEEVKALRDRGCTREMISMQGLGYKEIFSYLEGESRLEEAVAAVKEETRHFAKRQYTWFKREPDTVWIRLEDYDFDRERILQRMVADVRKLTEENDPEAVS